MYDRYFVEKRGWLAFMNQKEDHYPYSGTKGCSGTICMKALYSFSGLEQAVDMDEQSSTQENTFQSEKDLYSICSEHQLAIKANSLSEMLSLVELVEMGTFSREEALLSINADCIRDVVGDSLYPNRMNHELTPPQKLLLWSDQVRSMRIFAGGTTPEDVWIGKHMGAHGLGLVRCEELLKVEYLKDIITTEMIWAEELSVSLQRRLLCLLQEQWESIFYGLQGAPATVSLMPSYSSVHCSYPPDGIQDIMLEALFRAMRGCVEQGTDCTVDLLVNRPASAEQFADTVHWIEQVAEQTLGHMNRSIKYRVGALVPPNIQSSVAGDLARCTHLLVVEWDESDVTSSGDVMNMSIFHHIRHIHPSIHIRAVGHITRTDLPVIYTLGIDEISCAPQEVPTIRIATAQLELMEKASVGYHL